MKPKSFLPALVALVMVFSLAAMTGPERVDAVGGESVPIETVVGHDSNMSLSLTGPGALAFKDVGTFTATSGYPAYDWSWRCDDWTTPGFIYSTTTTTNSNGMEMTCTGGANMYVRVYASGLTATKLVINDSGI